MNAGRSAAVPGSLDASLDALHQDRAFLMKGDVFSNDLIDACEKRREPLSPLSHALLITEMVQGTYASHFAEGRRLPIPLTDRRHPLLRPI